MRKRYVQYLSFLSFLLLIPLFVLAQGEDLCEELFRRHGFLEEVEGNQALEWVRAQNDRTLARLKSDPRFAEIKARALELSTAKDRIVYGSFDGKFLYSFWKDEKNPKGLLRRTTLRRYLSSDPRWEIILDIDALSAQEGENWVYHGMSRLEEDETHALVTLSRGGKDADVVREFDLTKKEFVKGGFELPESKSGVTWLDQDTLIVGAAFEESERTESGYPRIIKLWKRGTALKDAPVIFEGKKEDVAVSAWILRREDGKKYVIFNQAYNFFEGDFFLINDTEEKVRVPLPVDASLERQFKGNALITLRSDWVFEGVPFKQGTLLYVNVDDFVQGGAIHVEVVFEPTDKITVNGVSRSKNHIFVNVLDNVRGRLIQMRRSAKGWIQKDVPLPTMGAVTVSSSSRDHHQVLVNYEDFLTPDTLYLYNARTGKLRPAKSLPPRFDPSKYVTEQFFATSQDGTKVPYFVVYSKEMELNGKNPTYLYGYGGFEVSEVPFYIDRQERLWLREGGVFVQANVRGGGEFGPAWHQAALKENRQKAFDDFIAVAEDLIARGITSPKHLGIRGGSNGGLLMGAVVTQRPDLFGAVMIDVPLLDMMRYHKLLAGASWMAEYGDPDDPKLRPYIFAYSPYHNVKPDRQYPEIFFETSTKDDRVHPAHPRKMAYYMEELGYPFLYYEDIDGGHGGGITPDHAAESAARFYTYFFQKLKNPEEEKSLKFQQEKERNRFKDYGIYVPNYLIPNLLRQELAEASSLLDIGTGTGRELPLLATLMPASGRITALDISKEDLSLAQDQIQILSNLSSRVESLAPQELKGLMIALEGLGYFYVDYVESTHLTAFELKHFEAPHSFSKPQARFLNPQQDERFRHVFPEALKKLNISFDPQKIKFLQADAVRLPFPDRSFEIVVLNDVLLYFDPQIAKIVLEEAKRVASKKVVFTNYPKGEDREALPGNTTMLSLSDLYWQLTLDLLNRGIDVSGVILNPEDLRTSYAHFHQLFRDKINLGYFYKKVSQLPNEEKKALLIQKYFLRPEGYFFLHDPKEIKTFLEDGEVSLETYSGGEMFSAERNVFIWRRTKD